MRFRVSPFLCVCPVLSQRLKYRVYRILLSRTSLTEKFEIIYTSEQLRECSFCEPVAQTHRLQYLLWFFHVFVFPSGRTQYSPLLSDTPLHSVRKSRFVGTGTCTCVSTVEWSESGSWIDGLLTIYRPTQIASGVSDVFSATFLAQDPGVHLVVMSRVCCNLCQPLSVSYTTLTLLTSARHWFCGSSFSLVSLIGFLIVLCILGQVTLFFPLPKCMSLSVYRTGRHVLSRYFLSRFIPLLLTLTLTKLPPIYVNPRHSLHRFLKRFYK